MTTVRYTTLPIAGFGTEVQYDSTATCDYVSFGPQLKWYFGTGAPTHSGNEGDMYTMLDDSGGALYVNTDGSTTWACTTD